MSKHTSNEGCGLVRFPPKNQKQSAMPGSGKKQKYSAQSILGLIDVWDIPERVRKSRELLKIDLVTSRYMDRGWWPSDVIVEIVQLSKLLMLKKVLGEAIA